MTRREALAAAGAAMTAVTGVSDGGEVPARRDAGVAPPLNDPNRFGIQLMEVLGLQGKRTKSIDIRCHAFEPVTVRTVEFADDEQGDGVVEVLKNYRLEEMASESAGDRFAEAMSEIECRFRGDYDTAHRELGRLMCDVLREAGYDKGCGIFDDMINLYRKRNTR